MIGIAQDQRSVDTFELIRRKRLDRGLRAHRRENWRDEVTMRCGKDSRAGAVRFGSDLEFKHWANYNLALQHNLQNAQNWRNNGFISVKTSQYKNLTGSS